MVTECVGILRDRDNETSKLSPPEKQIKTRQGCIPMHVRQKHIGQSEQRL